MAQTKQTFPSDSADKFVVRFPGGLRDRIAEAAKAAGRSMNNELVSRLLASFEPRQDSAELERQVDDLRATIAGQRAALNAHEAMQLLLVDRMEMLASELPADNPVAAQAVRAVKGIRERDHGLLIGFLKELFSRHPEIIHSLDETNAEITKMRNDLVHGVNKPAAKAPSAPRIRSRQQEGAE